MAKVDIESRSALTKAGDFFRECKQELAKSTKPTKQETIQATIVTLIIVVFVATCLAVFDLLFGSLTRQLL